jgi:hypothetical protein
MTEFIFVFVVIVGIAECIVFSLEQCKMRYYASAPDTFVSEWRKYKELKDYMIVRRVTRYICYAIALLNVVLMAFLI